MKSLQEILCTRPLRIKTVPDDEDEVIEEDETTVFDDSDSAGDIV